MGQVIKLGAQGKKELAIAFKVTMAYVGQVLSGQKKGGKAPAIWVNPEKPDVPLNKNDAFQKVQKRRVQEKR